MLDPSQPVIPVDDPAASRVVERALRLAETDLPIAIAGEPGTGRRTLAQSVARRRARRRGTEPLKLVCPTDAPEGTRGSDLVVLNLDSADLDRQRQIIDAASTLTATVRNAEDLVPEIASLGLPPLRERGGAAVIAWANHMLAEHPGCELTAEAEQGLMHAALPGNLSELRSRVVAAATLHGERLTPAHLGFEEEGGAIDSLADAVAEFKRSYIREVVKRLDGNKSRAAKALGVDPRTVFRILSESEGDS